MLTCAACEKPLREDVYTWTMGWSRADGLVNVNRRRDFDVRFHNKPECISVMSGRLDSYAWDLEMAKTLDAMGIDFGYEDDEELTVYKEVK